GLILKAYKQLSAKFID
ncbi:hypothetical protein FOXB_00793, partial [Fusarium oxysporum f. sp. conglutinans Fo5176]